MLPVFSYQIINADKVFNRVVWDRFLSNVLLVWRPWKSKYMLREYGRVVWFKTWVLLEPEFKVLVYPTPQLQVEPRADSELPVLSIYILSSACTLYLLSFSSRDSGVPFSARYMWLPGKLLNSIERGFLVATVRIAIIHIHTTATIVFMGSPGWCLLWSLSIYEVHMGGDTMGSSRLLRCYWLHGATRNFALLIPLLVELVGQE